MKGIFHALVTHGLLTFSKKSFSNIRAVPEINRMGVGGGGQMALSFTQPPIEFKTPSTDVIRKFHIPTIPSIRLGVGGGGADGTFFYPTTH